MKTQIYNGHVLPLGDPKQLYEDCLNCGYRVTTAKVLANAVDPCYSSMAATTPVPNPWKAKATIRVQGPDGVWRDVGTIKEIKFENTKKVCECGAEKTGCKAYAPGHSSWCPVKEVP